MDIIIISLYSNKDIFLRELISNASDALDKLRFLSLTDEEVLGEGDNAKLEIQIKLDKEKKILSIRDRGIGMMKEDLIKNLGTVAKSGTSAFVEKMQSSEDLNLIGQFGVGFYSVYLAADYVEAPSKHNKDKQYVWESKADEALAISEDTCNEPLGRGTEIRLQIRDEAGEYLEDKNLKAKQTFQNFKAVMVVVKRTAQLMYQAALMESGFMFNDPKDFASRIYSSVKSSLSISPDAIIEEEDDVEEVET
ncbi:hypothetical protein H0E87_031453 [Populus deltoides]|uniref:Histidine kinase/HSP90-like ATPase domain-containing protein n=1 Tax=Populus deltoides TaxID=3696 RepID=A0A8T2WEN7_POPDE|nr:hypothetical protein H0E87_031453 [Populus deltoides]